jgi:hypothetical protein
MIWQFKDTEFTRPDLDQFIGATLERWDSGTVLRIVCRRATRDAKAKAQQMNARGPINIVFEEDW